MHIPEPEFLESPGFAAKHATWILASFGGRFKGKIFFLVIVGISSLIKKNPVKLRISWQICFRLPIAMPAYSLIRCIILFRYLFINDTILPVPYIRWHPDISFSLQFLFFTYFGLFSVHLFHPHVPDIQTSIAFSFFFSFCWRCLPKARILCFRFILEYSSLRDFGPP